MLYKNDTILVREFLPEDLDLFLALLADPEVARYLPPNTPERYRQLFAVALEDYRKGLFSRWGIWDAVTNDFIGTCLARPFVEVPGQLEIGYTLAKAYWGRGIATTVSKALVAYCFTHTSARDVVALTHPDNIGSQKVLEKAGFSRAPHNIVRDQKEAAYFVLHRPA
ncbi:GNAT family N-acetyltransferase [Chitinophaga varians]|nr:GNAT family N-acetyltransferase [Chitinophaga varians]